MKIVATFETQLRDFCFPMYKRLNEPLTGELILYYFNKWGINDKNLIKLYEWKNGIDYEVELPTHSFDFTGFGIFPSLEFVDSLFSENLLPSTVKRTFFPLIVSFGGDFLFYETDKNSQDYGKIFLYCPTFGYVDYQVSYFDNFQTMLESIGYCFEKKIYIYDSDSMSLNIDFELSHKTFKRFNPESEYWKT